MISDQTYNLNIKVKVTQSSELIFTQDHHVQLLRLCTMQHIAIGQVSKLQHSKHIIFSKIIPPLSSC